MCFIIDALNLLIWTSETHVGFHVIFCSVHSNVLKVNMSEEESCPEHQESAEVKERVVTVMLHESKLEKAFRAVCLNGAILSTGLSLAFIGTALPDLQDRTKTSGFDEITKIFVVRGLGFLVGVILSNYLLRQTNQACWITFSLVVLAATMVAVPNSENLAFLMGVLFIQGATCGIIKTGCGFICQNHFFPADVAWSRMLFVSFGIGAFLAPVLLLSFTGITADETMKLIPLHYETVPFHLSTALANAQPSRSDLISPHVLARKRRNAIDQMWDNITDREKLLKQFTSDEFSNMSTVEYLNNVDKSTEPGVSSEYEGRSAEFNIGPFTTTANALFNNVNGQVTSDTNTSIAVVANDSSAVLLLNTTASGFIVTSSTTKMPKKPLIANGEILDPHRDVADSRKFRDQIRQNLAKPVPDVALPVNPSSTSTLQASVFSTFSTNSSVPTQNFSSPKVNVSGLQPDNQTLSVDGGDESHETKALPLSTLPSSAEWSSSFHLDSLLSTPIDSNPSSMPKSLIQSVSPSPPVSVMNITLRNTSVLTSNALPSSTVMLLKSTSAPSTSSKLSSEILTGVLNGTKSTVKPTRLAMWLSKYSYWTAAFMIGLAATAFAFYCVLCPRVYQTCLSFEAGDPTGIIICRFPACFIAVLFHMFYGGLEVSFAILITSFAVVVLEWSWWLGVMLSLVYWGSFSLGRLINYVFFSYLHQSVVLFGSLLVCITVAGSAFISFHPSNSISNGIVLHSSIVVIWLLVGILGFVMSAILPAGVAEIDKFLPRHSEFFQLLGASIGEMMLPPLIGIIVAMHDTVWLVYILLSTFVLCIIISTVVHFLVVQSREVRAPRTSRLLQSSECNDLEDVLVGTNDETELLAKSMYSHPGSTLNGHTNVPPPATSSTIQSLMKNINNVKID